jgi:hypothetical protein
MDVLAPKAPVMIPLQCGFVSVALLCCVIGDEISAMIFLERWYFGKDAAHGLCAVVLEWLVGDGNLCS